MAIDLELGSGFDRYMQDFRMPGEEQEAPRENKKDRDADAPKRRRRTEHRGKVEKRLFNLTLPEDLLAKVKVISSVRGWSVSAKVTEALEKLVADEMRKDPKLRSLFED